MRTRIPDRFSGMALGVAVLIGTISTQAADSETGQTYLNLKKIGDTKPYTRLFNEEKVLAFGKEWDAKKYCNEETVANPEMIEVYSLKHSAYDLAILCPGTLDGDENVVSVFSKSELPKTLKVKPRDGKSRISDQTLRRVIRTLSEISNKQ